MSSSSRKIILAVLVVGMIFISYLLGLRSQIKFREIFENLILITNKQQIDTIIDKLAECESNKNPLALNIHDKDGTASYGWLQYKPETFRKYAIKYGFIGKNASWNYIMTIIWDKEMQIRVAREMLKDEEVNPMKEWPICWQRVTKK